MKKTIIMPAYNEGKAIVQIVERCKKVINPGDEIIVVNDGSKDNTAEEARKTNVRVIDYQPNKGKTNALKEGFKAAKNEVIVMIDSDGNHPPEAIPLLVEKLKDADLVIGSRFKDGFTKEMSFHRAFANKAGAIFASFLLGAKITDVTSGFRAFRKPLVEVAFEVKAKSLDFEAEFTARTLRKKYRCAEVKINAEPRIGEESSLNFFKHLWLFFKALLRGRFS